MTLKSWWEVFPQGTKEGNEESRFFCAIARDKAYKWRSVDKLAEQTKLSKSRIEEIISKYHKFGMVYQNPKNPDQWGYWERVGEQKEERDILEEDCESRLNKMP